jgi:hypothetical protein
MLSQYPILSKDIAPIASEVTESGKPQCRAVVRFVSGTELTVVRNGFNDRMVRVVQCHRSTCFAFLQDVEEPLATYCLS